MRPERSERRPLRSFLIVTADDFGLHEAVNEAVAQASAAGTLTAASLMVAAPAAADAIRHARVTPQLRVGLHLVLADGAALLDRELIPALADSSGRMDGRMFVNALRFFARPSVRRQLEAEIRAQFAAFARTGLVLDHVNLHKHFHLHPTLLELVLRIGADFGMSALRLPREPLWFAASGGSRFAGTAGAVLLRPWLVWMRRRLRAAGILHNDQLFGIACSGRMLEPVLLRVLQRLPPGITEIYLHPAISTAAPISPSMREYRHADELAGLLSPRVRSVMDGLQVARGGYADAARG
jgi:hopanoid biosynthesis associated protein HpnK